MKRLIRWMLLACMPLLRLAAASPHVLTSLAVRTPHTLSNPQQPRDELLHGVRIVHWRDDVTCRALLYGLTSFTHGSHAALEWQPLQQQIEVRRGESLVNLKPYESRVQRPFARAVALSHTHSTSNDDRRWLLQVSCIDSSNQHLEIYPRSGVVVGAGQDAERIHTFFLPPPPPPASIFSAKRCPAPPAWLMRLRQSWVDTAKEMHEEASEWRWLEELRALTQRAAQRFNFPAHRLKLRRFLHLDAFSSIITAIRRWFDTISCTFRFLSSFFNSLFTLSASTWLGIFQLAMLHAILAFAMMRKAPVIVRVAQPVVSRNTSSPQQLPPPSHVRRRSIPWWQARSDPAEFPIASSAASSREHRAQPQTAAEKLLRRMRQEAEEKQSGSSEHHSAAEHPHQAESAPPHRLTIPQHLSASSHIVTPLMPTSPRLSSPRTAVPGGPAVFFSSHTRPSPLVATRSQPSTSSSAATASSAAEAPAEDRDPSPEPPGEQYDEVAPRI